jgi:hypothetical protein
MARAQGTVTRCGPRCAVCPLEGSPAERRGKHELDIRPRVWLSSPSTEQIGDRTSAITRR